MSKPLTLFGYEIPITFPLTMVVIILGGLSGFYAMQSSVAVMNQELITVVRELQDHKDLEGHPKLDREVIKLKVIVDGIAEDLKYIRKALEK